LDPNHDVMLSRYDFPYEHGLVLSAVGTPPDAPSWGPTVEVESGTTLPVWLAWAARRPLDQRITFTLHLLDGQEQLVAQVDQEMGSGHFPTTLWHEWMKDPVVVGEFLLPIPSHLSPGSYRLVAGAYQSETVRPLVGLNGDQWVELATVVVGRPAEPSLPTEVHKAEGLGHDPSP
jgi:hypothetical protein